MPRRLPPLNALRSFEAAARHGGFAAAAEELCVSHSAISHQVKKLEQYLGVELFSREGKGVNLTAAGSEYYPAIRAAFDRIADATGLIVAPHAPGIVTLQVYSTFAIRWLIPRLPEFQARYPEIRIRLHTSQSDVNFEHEDVDLCVMIGQPAHGDLHYDYLFSSRIFPVCSPALLQRSNPLEHPQDLAKHNIIQVYPSKRDWQTWLQKMNVSGVNPNAGQQFDSYDLAWNTAIQGLGVALGMEPFVNRDIEAGLLVEIFPGEMVHPDGDWYLACRKEKLDQKSFRLFREWLIAEVDRDEAMKKLK
jgi:LysR family glycine cleavage system transcriptional activator